MVLCELFARVEGEAVSEWSGQKELNPHLQGRNLTRYPLRHARVRLLASEDSRSHLGHRDHITSDTGSHRSAAITVKGPPGPTVKRLCYGRSPKRALGVLR